MIPFRPKTQIILFGVALIIFLVAAIQEIKLAQSSHLKSQPTQSNQINILTADKLSLTLLPGIGHQLAQRIITYRESNGITRVEELLKIKGIGPTLLERIKSRITIKSDKPTGQ